MRKNKRLVMTIVMATTLAIAMVGCVGKEKKEEVNQEDVVGGDGQDIEEGTSGEIAEDDQNGEIEENNTESQDKDDNKEENDKVEVTERQSELESIREAVAAAYEHYIPSMPFDAAYVEEIFKVKSEWYDAIIAEGPMMSAHVDTFMAIHPTEGNLENVVKGLESYKEYLINDSFQYPANMIKVKAGSIEVIGDYVYFIMLGSIDEEIVEEGEVLDAFIAQNEIALDVIRNHK